MRSRDVRVGGGRPPGVTGTGGIPVDANVRFIRAGVPGRRPVPPAPVEPDAATDVAPAKVPHGLGPDPDRSGAVTVPIVNKPARFPTSPLWPVELRADVAAAMLDFQTTRALCKAVRAGEAPPPTSVRGTGRCAEPVWSLGAVTEFVARRHGHA